MQKANDQYDGILNGSHIIPKRLSTSNGDILSSGSRANIIFKTYRISSRISMPEWFLIKRNVHCGQDDSQD